MKIYSYLSVLVLASLALVQPASARGLVVTPAQVGLVVAPGGTATETIYVGSPKAEVNRVRVSILDYQMNEEGKAKPVEQSHGRSARRWIEVDHTELEATGTGRLPLQLTVRVPEGATGSHWALVALYVLPESTGKPDKGMKLGVVPRVLVPVIITVSGAVHPKVTVKDFEATQTGNSVDFTAFVENDGDAAVMLSGAFALEKNVEGSKLPEEVASGTTRPTTSLPGSKIRIKGSIPWSGGPIDSSIMARLYLRYGKRPVDAVQGEAVVKNATPQAAKKS